VNINSDLGEGAGHDEEILPYIDSANVGCGLHAGSASITLQTGRRCRELGVEVGAHPSFPDRDGFGRRVLDVTGREAETDTLYQIGALDGFCRRYGLTLQHVKAHGALYNHASAHADVAEGIAAGVAAFGGDLILVALPGSELERAGRAAGLRVAREGFADRAYNPDGSLVSRRLPGAVHTDAATAAEQALRMVTEGKVRCLDGTVIDVAVDTLCCHGDNPHAVQFAKEVRRQLEEAGVQVRPLRT
jgi:UPF0271 protein